MKLINHTLFFLSVIFLITVGSWGVLYYYQVLRQIKTTVDEGLANYKIIVIDKLKDDSVIVQKSAFIENNYIARNISEGTALQIRDFYKDTLIYSNLRKKSYPSRLLTTAFVTADNKYYELKVISQELDKNRLIKDVTTSLLWLFIFLFISTMLINNLILKKIWKPFYRILNFLNEFHLDKESVYDPANTNIKEFSLLDKSVRKLLKTNIDTYNSQKQFIENASHEIQTPLAIGVNKLELLAEEKDLSPGSIQKISNVIGILNRLAGLNKSLLLLSKIENRQFNSDKQLDIDEVITRIVQDFSDFSDHRELKLVYNRKNSWFINMHRDLADILVMNLVKNSIIYNRTGGEIFIELSSGCFTIENTSDSPSLPEDDLFKRFNRNPVNDSSSGLGLAIVKAIADTAGLSINYSYSGRHIFKVFTLQV